MSTEENKALCRRIFEEIFNKRNLALADELIDVNFVMHPVAGPGGKGLEAIKEGFDAMIPAFPDMRFNIDDMLAEKDKVAIRSTFQGTHKGDFMGIAPTGKQFNISAILIMRFANGKLTDWWQVDDRFGMMQHLGVGPPMGEGGR